MKTVTIYTDGACSGNPGPGGYGAILMYGTHQKEVAGYEPHTTNNRMELMAAIKALEILKESCEVSLYTDSAYLCNAFKQGWLKKWQANGWKTASKSPVENQDLWHQLLAFADTHTLHLHKVKGHSDNPYNNRCDELARTAITQNRG